MSLGGFLVVIPEMQRYLVIERSLLSPAQLAASIAIGQAAPGPNVQLVAVIGWQIAGAMGAAVCMLAAVLPSVAIAGDSTARGPFHARSLNAKVARCAAPDQPRSDGLRRLGGGLHRGTPAAAARPCTFGAVAFVAPAPVAHPHRGGGRLRGLCFCGDGLARLSNARHRPAGEKAVAIPQSRSPVKATTPGSNPCTKRPVSSCPCVSGPDTELGGRAAGAL